MRWRERCQGRRVNRPRGEGARQRAAKKLLGPATWFRPKPRVEEDTAQMEGAPTNLTNRRLAGDAGPSSGMDVQQIGAPRNKTNAQQREVETVVFIPATQDSLLRKALQTIDNKFADLHRTPGVRFVEMGGAKLSSVLSRADPWAGAECGRVHYTWAVHIPPTSQVRRV